MNILSVAGYLGSCFSCERVPGKKASTGFQTKASLHSAAWTATHSFSFWESPGHDGSLSPYGTPPDRPEAQRSILRSLVEHARDRRGAALFALGYWAGCRVSELSWLGMADIHVGPREGWLHVGHDGSKGRDINLIPRTCMLLYAYLQATHDSERTYVFMSQRGERLTEEGVYSWFRTLKAQASKDQQEVIKDITFHDLRYDFAHRAREAGWSLEKVACYLGVPAR